LLVAIDGACVLQKMWLELMELLYQRARADITVDSVLYGVAVSSNKRCLASGLCVYIRPIYSTHSSHIYRVDDEQCISCVVDQL